VKLLEKTIVRKLLICSDPKQEYCGSDEVVNAQSTDQHVKRRGFQQDVKIADMGLSVSLGRDKDEWSHKGILRYVYANYPEYTSKTEVPHLKW
jgi:hypothetical protein